jgi:hypothetical protein
MCQGDDSLKSNNYLGEETLNFVSPIGVSVTKSDFGCEKIPHFLKIKMSSYYTFMKETMSPSPISQPEFSNYCSTEYNLLTLKPQASTTMDNSIATISETKDLGRTQSSTSFTTHWESCLMMSSSSSLLSSNRKEDKIKAKHSLIKVDQNDNHGNHDKNKVDLKLDRSLMNRESFINMDPSSTSTDGDTSSWRASSTISTLTDVLDDHDDVDGDDEKNKDNSACEGCNSFKTWSLENDPKKLERKQLPEANQPNESYHFISSETFSDIRGRQRHTDKKLKSAFFPGLRRISAFISQHRLNRNKDKTKKQRKSYQSGRYYPLAI